MLQTLISSSLNSTSNDSLHQTYQQKYWNYIFLYTLL